MSTLDQVLTNLLDPAGRWQLEHGRRYRTARLGHGLGLRYTPGRGKLEPHTLSISRRDTPPSQTEIQTVVTSLGRVLERPDLAVLITEAGPTIRRLNWRPTPKAKESPDDQNQ